MNTLTIIPAEGKEQWRLVFESELYGEMAFAGMISGVNGEGLLDRERRCFTFRSVALPTDQAREALWSIIEHCQVDHIHEEQPVIWQRQTFRRQLQFDPPPVHYLN